MQTALKPNSLGEILAKVNLPLDDEIENEVEREYVSTIDPYVKVVLQDLTLDGKKFSYPYLFGCSKLYIEDVLIPANIWCSPTDWVNIILAKGFSDALLMCYACWANKRGMDILSDDFAKNIKTSFGTAGTIIINPLVKKKSKLSIEDHEQVFAQLFNQYQNSAELRGFGMIGFWFNDTALPHYWFGAVLERYIRYCRKAVR